MIVEDNSACNGKKSDGAIFFLKNWGKYTEETDMRKETIRTPAKRERLGEENENGSEILKESGYYFRDCLLSAYLLKKEKKILHKP